MLRYAIFAVMVATAGPAAARGDSDPDHYAAGDVIRAEFSLDERTREGGRITPVFTSYRPRVTVDGGQVGICRFAVAIMGGLKPGTTGQIGMTCPMPMTEGQTFIAYENVRPIGRGVILPRAAAD